MFNSTSSTNVPCKAEGKPRGVPLEGPTGHNAPLDTWPEPCRAKVGVGRRPTTRAEKDCSLGAGHTGEETPPGGCTAPPKLSRFTTCSPEGYPPHCAALRFSLLGTGEAVWGRGGASPPLCLTEIVVLKREARGKRPWELHFREREWLRRAARCSGNPESRKKGQEGTVGSVPLRQTRVALPLVSVPSPHCGAPAPTFP